MRGKSVIRSLLLARRASPPMISSISNCIPNKLSSPTRLFPSKSSFSFSSAAASVAFGCRISGTSCQHQRAFCSSIGRSKIEPIKSEEELNSSLKSVQEKSLSAIFYFTAVWCGPCRFLSPVIEELSEKYPNVSVYKIDIDQEGLGHVLNQLRISSVPTLYFYKDGKWQDKVVGADVARLKDYMQELYGKV